MLTRKLEPAATQDTVGISEVQEAQVFRRAVFLDGAKYVRTWFPTASEELYSLAVDPQEQVNVLERDASAVDRHRAILQRHILSSPVCYRFVVESTGNEPIRVEGALHADGARLVEIQLRDVESDDGPCEVVPVGMAGLKALGYVGDE